MRRARDLAVPVRRFSRFIVQPCRRNSLLKCASKSKIAKTQTSYFGSSRSSEIIDVDTIKKLVTSACYDKSMSVSICNCFHAKGANSGKITNFKGDTRI